VFDVWENLIRASHTDDGLGGVSLFSLVSQFRTANPAIAFSLRLFSGHDLISVCCHDYLLHFLFPHGIVVLGQLRDVAVSALQSFGKQSAGGWCFPGFEGLLRAAGRRCEGSW